MSDLSSQVKEMAKLTMLTHRVSDLQVKNMKMYPFVFFESIANASIEYDLSNNLGVTPEGEGLDSLYKINKPESDHLFVRYNLELDERFNGSMDKRFKALEKAIHDLFWPQVKVELFVNGKDYKV